MELTDRRKKILRAVVEQYIETAEPVGSKSLLENASLGVSSATIRNEMAELLTLGLLEQPHTSAGRVPSALGYRIYVNELMEEHRLSLQETKSMNEALQVRIHEMDQVMTEAGRIISQVMRYPAFALSTGHSRVSIARFELLCVEDGSFIVVVLTSTQTVKTKIIRLDAELQNTQLALLSALLNSNFTGKTLEELVPELQRVSQNATGEALSLIQMVLDFAMEVLRDIESSTVHTAGIPSLLAQPEYQSLDSAEPIMNFLADWEDAEGFPSVEEGVKILIGPENVAEELKNSSVIVARYDIGDNMQGLIGVVGPTRMDYAKLAARLSYFAQSLSRLFGKGELGNGETDPNRMDHGS